ncbi:hydrolase 2, exosortase A system-associated [Pseudorhodoferax sp.]|uniref:hydrolase 2, exosortase A system-associated n=1 Tax=Pseudorhodoferax sp. TaxID=1993553 RepID=UPI002DD66EA6|nr:hydrolase 2, exosortase A system-associated [Pseudorhodoferax sp.]
MQAFFLPAQPGQRFCILHTPTAQPPRGAVVYVHPFAEEMNKARRMAALQARALAQAGYVVLQIDLLGCGDSSGEFGDAGWSDWLQDVQSACGWLAERHPGLPLWLWGLRSGCLLAAQAAAQLALRCSFVFWAPTPSGKTVLQQFLRLKSAAALLDGSAKGVTEGLRRDLAAGQTVEIAGYGLSAALAQGLEQASLAPPAIPDAPAQRPRLLWLDLSTQETASLSPVAQKTLAQWQAAGHDVHSEVVLGPQFWQTTEIEDAPALLAATLAAMTAPAVTPQEAVSP